MQTRKLTILMAHQDGTPFVGYVSVRLSSASKTDEELVGPLVWQESEFDATGKVELQLVPNTELAEGTFYTCQIYVVKTANGYKSKSKVVDTAFAMPDEDSFLHDLSAVAPVSVSSADAVQLMANRAEASAVRAEQAAVNAEQVVAPATDQEIDALFQ